ncbi:MAG: sugar ABC transporter substrate-binding protein [Planctomycetes bacterium]|nr:sugar ABC transporter substrate-binding protein [Planctomycetota bacterium]
MSMRRIATCVLGLSLSLASLAHAAAGERNVAGKGYKIGFAAYMMGQEWYQNIAAGAQARADELGVELRVADCNNDSNTQVSAIENFLIQQVDAVIVSPVDVNTLGTVVAEATADGVKVVAESNMIPGAVTRVGQSDKDSGKKAGAWYAGYAKENNITPRILILGYKALDNCRARVEGFKEALDEAGIDYEVKIEVDGGFREASLKAATGALTAHPDINCIFGINDDSTLGAVAAVRSANLDESGIVAIIYGLEGAAGRAALQEGGIYAAGLSMFPEFVGAACVDAAVAALEGEDLPENYASPTVVIPAADFSAFFIEEDGAYLVNFAAVRGLE